MIKDILLFFIIVVVPSNIFGILNPEWLYLPGLLDVRMLFIIPCTFLSVLLISKWRLILQIPGGIWLLFIAFYIGIQFILSTFQFGIYNSFKVFRYYCFPIVLLGPLIYILYISKERRIRIIKWTFIATILQGIFYILHHLGISIFYSPVHEVIEYGLRTVQRFNYGFPNYCIIFLATSILFVIYKNRFNYLFSLVILSMVVILYASRNVILQVMFSIVLVLILSTIQRSGRIIGRSILIIFIIIINAFVFQLIFPQYPIFIAERFSEIMGSEGFQGALNYNKRILMVNIAIEEMKTIYFILFGHGYKFWILYGYANGNIFLESDELSMQGDAPIAGLLWSEGIVGILLRALPFAILLFKHIRLFNKEINKEINKEDVIISILVIVMITGIGLTWLQTTQLRDIPFSLIPLYLIHSFHSCNKYQIKYKNNIMIRYRNNI